ncbi:AQG_2a_G0039630.mRNA.1.CDS.1 [Saccharomyces cerevisiae]|nr:AQG_2a_G0039630.mRNA.1.CDS.1 [Saccharomyces cerevisiae]CAI7260694.1 AQG_2a_G0039630.mRNA.1.CDS.1 [Saccharomyces cerevisiae]
MKYHLVALLSLLTQKPGELPPNSSSSSIQRLVMGKFTIFQQGSIRTGFTMFLVSWKTLKSVRTLVKN